MKKFSFGCLALMMLFVSGCAGNSDKQSAAEPAKEMETIKIGAWLPSTGPAAVYGTVQRAGIDAYYDMINKNGGVNGRKIQFIVEDSGRDPQQTVAAARKLVERDQVFALVNSFGVAQSEATFSFVLNDSKVPLINIYGGLTTWYNPPRDNLYGVMVPYEFQADALGRWAAKEGAKSILVVHDDPAAYETIAKRIDPGAKTFADGVKVELLPVKYGTTDYAPIALEVTKRKPDAIVLIQPIEELVLLTKALERSNFKVPMYTYAPNTSISTLELGGGSVEGLRAMSWTLPPTSDASAVKEYRDTLQAYDPKAKPDFQSMFTWAEAKIFVEALKRIEGTPTREKLVKAIESLNRFETQILPPVTFGKDKHLGIKELQPVKVENGKWVTVGGFIDPSEKW